MFEYDLSEERVLAHEFPQDEEERHWVEQVPQPFLAQVLTLLQLPSSS